MHITVSKAAMQQSVGACLVRQSRTQFRNDITSIEKHKGRPPQWDLPNILKGNGIIHKFLLMILSCIGDKKKSPLKNRVALCWLAVSATQISVNRLFPGRVTSALAPDRHTEGDISQHYRLSSCRHCCASCWEFTHQLISQS